jgi:CYTH domain-containing protein
MATEIERKFLVIGDAWRDTTAGVRLCQGYLSKDPERAVRVRIAGEQAWLTIKGRGEHISRPEFEFEIPANEARELMHLCLPGVIEKTRYRIDHAGHVWEVDEFHGDNEGLVMAEVELDHADILPELPSWAGREVSDDARYFNSQLSIVPYRNFREPDESMLDHHAKSQALGFFQSLPGLTGNKS